MTTGYKSSYNDVNGAEIWEEDNGIGEGELQALHHVYLVGLQQELRKGGREGQQAAVREPPGNLTAIPASSTKVRTNYPVLALMFLKAALVSSARIQGERADNTTAAVQRTALQLTRVEVFLPGRRFSRWPTATDSTRAAFAANRSSSSSGSSSSSSSSSSENNRNPLHR
eukprot:g16754.t1